MDSQSSGSYQFDLGLTRRRKGWTKERPTHYKSGSPKELPITPIALLDIINSNIEEVYLARGIYPGASLHNGRLGHGTVITCSLHSPFFFSFLPNTAGDDDDDTIPRLRYYDPEDMEQNDWGVLSKDGTYDFVRLASQSDLNSLELTSEQRTTLVNLCSDSSNYQLGHAIRFLLEELRDKVRSLGGGTK